MERSMSTAILGIRFVCLLAVAELSTAAKWRPSKEGIRRRTNSWGLYWITDGAYNTIFLVTPEGVVAVDGPPALGLNYLKARFQKPSHQRVHDRHLPFE